jgi:hypothetical protein
MIVLALLFTSVVPQKRSSAILGEEEIVTEVYGLFHCQMFWLDLMIVHNSVQELLMKLGHVQVVVNTMEMLYLIPNLNQVKTSL